MLKMSSLVVGGSFGSLLRRGEEGMEQRDAELKDHLEVVGKLCGGAW